MKLREVVYCNLPFWVRTDRDGDEGILQEVVQRDCYGLADLAATGFKPRVIVDIGASCGAFSVLAASYWPTAFFVCVECNPDAQPALRANLKRHVADFKLVEAAFTYEERAVFYDVLEPEGVTGGGVCTAAPAGPDAELMGNDRDMMWARFGRPREVKTVCMRDWGNDPIDLMKIDCEGGEMSWLKRAAPEDFAAIREIRGEYHDPEGRAHFADLFRSRFPGHRLTFPVAEDFNPSAPFIAPFFASPAG